MLLLLVSLLLSVFSSEFAYAKTCYHELDWDAETKVVDWAAPIEGAAPPAEAGW